MLNPHIITLVCSNQALSHYTSFFSFCSASAFSFFTPACTAPNAAMHYRGECMQHVERNKCVFISSRLIYSPLAWRRERRTTICNELDVSDRTVFCSAILFITTLWLLLFCFFGLYLCVCTSCFKQKSLWCWTEATEYKNGMEAWNCRWALWGPWLDRVQMHYPLHKDSTSDIDGEIFFFFAFLEENGRVKSLWSGVSVFVIDYESAGVCFKMPVFSGLT